MGDRNNSFFDIDKIEQNYRLVMENFERINRQTNCSRDVFGEEIAGNLLCGYDWINRRLAKNRHEFLSLDELLEINMIVHLGNAPSKRAEYGAFVNETGDKLCKYAPSLLKWYRRHEKKAEDPYKIAAGLYVRVLARPQLYLDGNHRTGSLIANCYLLMKGENPFIMTPHNAVEFLDLASDIKFKKDDIGSKFKRAVGWRDELARMRAFLKINALPYTTSTPSVGPPRRPSRPCSVVADLRAGMGD
ncbi:MAG: hypothetical protein IPI58_08030 [Alphaproteobacteria bacterium]|nr:MAG: hypothetical protein IPI58_08030 [Alphaproteobacteria bacterium]